VSADVTIPEAFEGGPGAICAPSTITGQWLCGQGLAKGDHYADYPTQLLGGTANLITEVIIRIQVGDVQPLELDGGGEVRVNPVLMPVVCDPVEIEPPDCLDA